MQNTLTLSTQEKLILSVLEAHASKARMPWGITELGWAAYTNHRSEKVRTAALQHPDCPARYRHRNAPEERIAQSA